MTAKSDQQSGFNYQYSQSVGYSPHVEWLPICVVVKGLANTEAPISYSSRDISLQSLPELARAYKIFLPTTGSHSITINWTGSFKPKSLIFTMRITSKSMRAALLLPKDLSLYVKWQKQNAPGSDIGQICDALDYYRFINYRDALLTRTRVQPRLDVGLHIASECRHIVHPGNAIITEFCPICEVKAHLAFTNAISVAWTYAGGPRLLPGTRVRKKSYGALRDGWHMARLQLQELLDMFAIVAIYEQDWETKNPSQAAAARTMNSASAAIELAQAESKYPARLNPPSAKKAKAKLVRKEMKVTFATEVQIQDKGVTFPAATVFAHDRPLTLYYRPGRAYQPGSHACPLDSEFLDTSQSTLLPADISNLKIYITDDEDAFDRLTAQPSLYADSVGNHQGIVGLHRLNSDVFQLIHEFVAQESGAQEELEDLVEEADRLVALVDEYENLLDIFFMDGSDEGEIDKDDESAFGNEKGVETGSWTCLRECLL